ncbi:MAG TPA: aminodeoxychorismate synthase component I [Steroidobacteraceae bacterium]
MVRELDVPGTVLRQLAAQLPDAYPVLLDSAAQGPLSRMSILAARPHAALWLDDQGKLGAEGFTPAGTSFLAALENWWRAERVPRSNATFPFTGGWFVFLSYEIAREIEPRLQLPRAPIGWQAFALRTSCALVHDLATNKVFAIAETDSAHVLERVIADALDIAKRSTPMHQPLRVAEIREEAPEVHMERVRRAKDYIRAGDIYQANLSRPWDVILADDVSAGAVYERLCAANPAPFAALVQWRGVSILSSSPERLARVSDGKIETRPIAGTRPRSRKPGGDVSEMSELAAHPKERAEHVMLIDLERNDLGRVCLAGTVKVDEFMTIESYAHVHHIVSNVSGRLRSDVTPIGALRAVFPGGTITGCPKIRCMEIIAELEGIGRGAYTGSLGFLSRDGTMDMNILIRTMTMSGRHVTLRAGGGIVADSIPERELEETRAKARGLLATFASTEGNTS